VARRRGAHGQGDFFARVERFALDGDFPSESALFHEFVETWWNVLETREFCKQCGLGKRGYEVEDGAAEMGRAAKNGSLPRFGAK